MKKTIFILFLLLTTFASAQIKLDALEWRGKVTTTIRDAYVVPTGGAMLIWNTDDQEFQYADDSQVWTVFKGVSAADQDKLDNILITQSVDLDALESSVATLSTPEWDDILNKPVNLDIDSTDDLSANENETITSRWDFNILQSNKTALFVDGTNYWAQSYAATDKALVWGYTTTPYSSFIGQYRLNTSGTPTSSIDLTTKSYVDNAVSSSDQTLSEVLAEGNTAGVSIDMNGNDIYEISDIRFKPIGTSDIGWELRSTTESNDLAVIAESGNGTNVYSPILYTFNNSGTPLNPADVATKSYVDANSGTDNQNASEVPYTDTYSIGETDVQGALDYFQINKGGLSDSNIWADYNNYTDGIVSEEIYIGKADGTSDRRWKLFDADGGTNNLGFSLQSTDDTDIFGTSFPTQYKLNGSGPTSGNDIATVEWVEAQGYGSGSSTPQTISLTDTNLTLSDGGGTVDLSVLQDGTGTDDQTALEVPIVDAADNFTAVEVEGALKELAENMDASQISYLSGLSEPTENTVERQLDSLVTSKIENKVSTWTEGDDYTRPIAIVYQTEAQSVSTGAPPTGVSSIITDPTPASSFTGTVIPLDGYYQHDDTSNDTAAWTIGTSKNGGIAEILINLASEPTITGATQITGTTDFSASTLMLLTVKNLSGTEYYYFMEL